ncbi:hypothetical protein C8J56DRAFT_899700 [Mycena floridula]|nr:hypothetical protein C8J56DRAFT_899700 [Mycena floridula]
MRSSTTFVVVSFLTSVAVVAADPNDLTVVTARAHRLHARELEAEYLEQRDDQFLEARNDGRGHIKSGPPNKFERWVDKVFGKPIQARLGLGTKSRRELEEEVLGRAFWEEFEMLD